MAVLLFVSTLAHFASVFLQTLVELLSQKYIFFTEKCKLMILFFEVARLLGHLTPIFAPDFKIKRNK